MGWVIVRRVADLLTLVLLIIMISIVMTNSKSSEDFGNFGLKLDKYKQESAKVMSSNIEYMDKRVNGLAETQDRYQVSTDQRVYILESQMKLMMLDRKTNQKIINNNNSNAVIYQEPR
jgi:hypothetical protein